jgi:hypothetical protein
MIKGKIEHIKTSNKNYSPLMSQQDKGKQSKLIQSYKNITIIQNMKTIIIIKKNVSKYAKQSTKQNNQSSSARDG